MNAKRILFLGCFVAVMLAASLVTAAPHGNNHFTRSGSQHWNGRQHWSGRQHWNGGNWRHHNHFNDVTFIGGFGGFPFWGWGYPYAYYGPYPYGYYGNSYYGSTGYGYGGGYGYRQLHPYYGHHTRNYGYVGYGHRSSRTYHGHHGHR